MRIHEGRHPDRLSRRCGGWHVHRPVAPAVDRDSQRSDERMSLEHVPSGSNVPEDVNVIIEIPMNAEPVKYEVDKATGAIFVDRVLTTPMRYPCNYGYVPHTLSGDGDPV